MSLPPIESSPALMVRFTAKASDRLIHLCRQRWSQSGLIVLQERHCTNGAVILTMTTTQEALLHQAERLRLVKRTADTNVMEYFQASQAARFRQATADKIKHNRHHYLDADGMFTAQERAFLISRLFQHVTVLDNDDLARLLEMEYHAKLTLHIVHVKNMDRESVQLAKQQVQVAPLWHVLAQCQLVDCHMPVHQPALRDRVVAETTLAPVWRLSANVTLLHDYFGHELGFYFCWISFLTRWYFFPGVLGVLVYVLRLYNGETIDTDPYTPFYGLVCFFWAILFCRFWERQEKRLAYNWGTYSLSHYERQKYFAKRPEFRGMLRKSPITGEYETYYPATRRRLAYVVSAVVTTVMLAVAFGVMILSLNLQGYINPKHNPQRWHADNPHPFHFPNLAVLAEPGHVLDAATMRNFIPVIIHVLCISTLNSIYRTIAKALTMLENHETQVDYANSLVVKRFLFEAFDCWVALFYLAFYERNVDRLRAELVGVFQIDTVRRAFLECIVPILVQSYQHGHFVLPKSWNSFAQRPASMEDILEDVEKDVYEPFDDYMEIVIQFGCKWM